MTDFIAIDVETANADMASICQIGAVTFKDGQVVDEWVTYVDPEDEFEGMNVSIHGITERDVAGAPTMQDAHQMLQRRFGGQLLVSHTAFDRVAINQATVKYGLEELDATWLDSARMARRTWLECSQKGYGLKSLCKMLGHEFNHHDALEDAKAAGFIACKAIEDSGIPLDDWPQRSRRPITATSTHEEGNPDGALFGEVAVFTGTLAIPRREASSMAAELGITVASNVSKKVTMLIVGDQDISKLAGHDKSTKHRKTEDLIAKGQAIRILKESDFRELFEIDAV